ncbi:response regulator [bacterium]|nr:response regulator [bacterium]
MSDKRRVLLVDDDVDFLEANRVALEARGFEVLTASDSRHGVEVATREHPDLIIMDLMMERLYAGFSAVQALAAHEATAEIPVIMVSAVTTETGFRVDDKEQRPEWLRVVEFINKPIDPLALADKASAIVGA